MLRLQSVFLVFLAIAACRAAAHSRRSLRESAVALPDGLPYDMGPAVLAPANQSIVHIWVDPVKGKDTRTGLSVSQALKSLSLAWGMVPQGTLTKGYHIHILKGTITEATGPMSMWWENRHGTYAAPIIIEAAQGKGTVTFNSVVNVFNCSYIYFVGVNMTWNSGDVFHCERCTGLLLRGVTVRGGPRATTGVWEAVKLNQCQGVYIEDCDMSGAGDNAIDMVAVQYGHVLKTKIWDAEWCIYLKGGSAYFILAGNTVYNCGSSGMSVGQGTGFEYMVPPWLRYEAYDIKIFNNVVYNVDGAGLGVWGGYNILVAHNTLYKVGKRSHMIEVNLGDHSCDGDELLLGKCTEYRDAGGWGLYARLTGADDPVSTKIPNKNVIIANNLVYNPPKFSSMWQHFNVEPSSESHCLGCTDERNNMTATTRVRADDGLVIRGNVLWNVKSGIALGIPSGDACSDSHPTCSAAEVLSRNIINSNGLEPKLVNATAGNFSLATNAVLKASMTSKLWNDTAFAGWEAGLSEPAGNLSLVVQYDAAGKLRNATANAAGAFCW